MNKELTPLEALDYIKKNFLSYEIPQDSPNCVEELFIIETALKEKETQDSIVKTLKEVIEFSQVLPHIEPNKDNGFDIMSAVSINIQRDIENKERELLRQWVLKECFPKELKALEIIKEKRIIIDDFITCDELWIYNQFKPKWKQLTQEEYDLLREALL